MRDFAFISIFLLGVALVLCCFAIGFPEWTVRRHPQALERTENISQVKNCSMEMVTRTGYLDIKDGLFQECRFFNYQPIKELDKHCKGKIPSSWTYCDYYGQGEGPAAEPFKIACAFFMLLCLVLLLVAFILSFCGDQHRDNGLIMLVATAMCAAAAICALISFFTWIGVSISQGATGGNLGPCIWLTLVVAILALVATPLCFLAARERKSPQGNDTR